MTADSDTPETGHESIDFRETRPLEDASDERVALAIEEQKQKARVAADDVCRALLNDDVPLTDEKVAALGDTAEALSALVRTVTMRVPPEHQFEE